MSETFEWAGRSIVWQADGDGPPVALCHGTPFSSGVWRPYAETLAADFNVYTWDMPGYGRSSKRPEDPVDFASQRRCGCLRRGDQLKGSDGEGFHVRQTVTEAGEHVRGHDAVGPRCCDPTMAGGIAVVVGPRPGRSGLSDAPVRREPGSRGVGNPSGALLGRAPLSELDVGRVGELRGHRFERVEDEAATEVARRPVLRDQRSRDKPTRRGFGDRDALTAFLQPCSSAGRGGEKCAGQHSPIVVPPISQRFTGPRRR
jgi:pimeloyl-ACP methyl ester carboxylesterase